jgi:glycosyltransferase involved in cell wall biosynthesis
MKIVFVSDIYRETSVYESQVHTLCNAHAVSNEVHLINLAGYKSYFKPEIKGARYKSYKALRLPHFFVPRINRINSYIISTKIESVIENADVVHCRGQFGASYALNILDRLSLSKPVIADIRGVAAEEIAGVDGRESPFNYRQIIMMEAFVFERSTYYFFVSEPMKVYFSQKYCLDNTKSSVFPTIVDNDLFRMDAGWRKEYRARLNIQDKYVYAYVGGVDRWQNVDRILLRFHEVSAIDDSLVLLLIVTDLKYVHSILERHGINNDRIMVFSLPYSEVGKFLNAADAGIIVRDDILINRVSSPTKVNEYLACGLMIVDKLESIGHKMQRSSFIGIHKTLIEIIAEQQHIYERLRHEDQT